MQDLDTSHASFHRHGCRAWGRAGPGVTPARGLASGLPPALAAVLARPPPALPARKPAGTSTCPGPLLSARRAAGGAAAAQPGPSRRPAPGTDPRARAGGSRRRQPGLRTPPAQPRTQPAARSVRSDPRPGNGPPARRGNFPQVAKLRGLGAAGARRVSGTARGRSGGCQRPRPERGRLTWVPRLRAPLPPPRWALWRSPRPARRAAPPRPGPLPPARGLPHVTRGRPRPESPAGAAGPRGAPRTAPTPPRGAPPRPSPRLLGEGSGDGGGLASESPGAHSLPTAPPPRHPEGRAVRPGVGGARRTPSPGPYPGREPRILEGCPAPCSSLSAPRASERGWERGRPPTGRPAAAPRERPPGLCPPLPARPVAAERTPRRARHKPRVSVPFRPTALLRRDD